MRKINYVKGSLYYADLDPVIGSEQGGIRPVLVVSNDLGNKHSPTVVIAPLTSKVVTRTLLPTHVRVKAFEGIKNDSVILVEQVRSIDKKRLHSFLGRLEIKQEIAVEKALIIEFGIGVRRGDE